LIIALPFIFYPKTTKKQAADISSRPLFICGKYLWTPMNLPNLK